MSDVCRGCRKSGDNLKSIFEGDCATKFTHVTSLTVSKDDGLPYNICQDCSFTNDLFYDFKNKSLQSEKFFRQKIYSEKEYYEKFLHKNSLNNVLIIMDNSIKNGTTYNQDSKICRCCISTSAKLLSMQSDRVIIKLYENCTSLKVNKEDLLPLSVCVVCFFDAYSYYEYKETCLRSDDFFRTKMHMEKIYDHAIKDCQKEPIVSVKSEIDGRPVEAIVTFSCNMEVKLEVIRPPYSPDFFTQEDEVVESNNGLVIDETPLSDKSDELEIVEEPVVVVKEDETAPKDSSDELEIIEVPVVTVKNDVVKINGSQINKTEKSDNSSKAKVNKQYNRNPRANLKRKTVSKTINFKALMPCPIPKKFAKSECDICHRVFIDESAMSAHRADHTEFMCLVCSTDFYSKVRLKRHTDFVKGKKFDCKTCNKSFHYEVLRDKHEQSHSSPHLDGSAENKAKILYFDRYVIPADGRPF